ncbi:MAG TPA: DUF2497 domain-containing protein [Stellaceae bacterium]|nr:DUF2497 domain-containing protein [Stellaceae bacterium]
MEEIIASISRIITEDKRPSEPVPPTIGETDDILELTEAVNEDGSVRRLAPAPATASENLGTPPSPTAPDPKRAELAKPEGSRERILSSTASEATAAAFAQLGALPRERRREGELSLGGTDRRTLEDIVREMLRPLLQSWLDEHLPGIVERLVREEIARVVGEAGLR